MGHDEDRDQNLGFKLLSVLNLVQIQGMFTQQQSTQKMERFFLSYIFEKFCVQKLFLYTNFLRCQNNPHSHRSKKRVL